VLWLVPVGGGGTSTTERDPARRARVVSSWSARSGAAPVRAVTGGQLLQLDDEIDSAEELRDQDAAARGQGDSRVISTAIARRGARWVTKTAAHSWAAGSLLHESSGHSFWLLANEDPQRASR
jgi:hypothetical protein